MCLAIEHDRHERSIVDILPRGELYMGSRNHPLPTPADITIYIYISYKYVDNNVHFVPVNTCRQEFPSLLDSRSKHPHQQHGRIHISLGLYLAAVDLVFLSLTGGFYGAPFTGGSTGLLCLAAVNICLDAVWKGQGIHFVEHTDRGPEKHDTNMSF